MRDPSIDFDALFKQFETAILGRKTYELLIKQGGNGALPGLDVIVFSRRLPAAVRPGLRIVNDDAVDVAPESRDPVGLRCRSKGEAPAREHDETMGTT